MVRPRLLKIPGVGEIFTLGGDRKQYQVLLDPAALLEWDVTLQQLEQALKDNNLNASFWQFRGCDASRLARMNDGLDGPFGREAVGPRTKNLVQAQWACCG